MYNANMKTLSLLQPWASLVVMGVKKIETRSWKSDYRGPLLIHASLGKKGSILSTESPFKKYIRNFESLPFGSVIGVVLLEDIVPIEQLFLTGHELASLTMEEKAFGDYSKGRYAWLLTAPQIFDKPIPVKGTLGLWEFNPTGEPVNNFY